MGPLQAVAPGPTEAVVLSFLATLGLDPLGVRREVQWEIALPESRARPDVTEETAGEVKLYEVKRTSNASYPRTMRQLNGYQLSFATRDVDTVLERGTTSTTF